jgi:hypothetical protein
MTRQQKGTTMVQVGQRYIGWDKTWVVTRVWPKEGVAAIENVDKPENTARLPLTQFKTLQSI